MKLFTTISALTLAFFIAVPAFAATDYFLKIGDIKGESTTEAKTETETGAAAGSQVAPSQTKVLLQAETAQQNETDLEFVGEGAETSDDGSLPKVPQPIRTQSDTAMKESGEKGGTADINIGVGELTEDDSAALRGVYIKIGDIKGESEAHGGGGGDIIIVGSLSEETEVRVSGVEVRGWDPETKEAIEGAATDDAATVEAFAVLAAQAAAEDELIEEVSLNFEKIKWEYKSEGRVFGLFPISFTKEIEVTTGNEGQVKVKFPWYRALMTVDVRGDVLQAEIEEALNADQEVSASGEASIQTESRKFQTISNVLKARHDVAMNSIRNSR